MVNYIKTGDCRQLIKELPDNSVDVVFTSPPYNRIRNDTYEFYDDTCEEYFQLLCDITRESLRVARDKVIINIQTNHFNKRDVYRWIGEFSEQMSGGVVWTKTNPQPAHNYHEEDNTRSITNAYEEFYFLTKDGKEFRGYGKENIMNYLHTNINAEHIEGHGAIMKKEVAEWFISRFTKKGDIVLDPFMGTGTTAIVCHNLGRKYIGYEISKEYTELAERRIKEETAQMRFDVLLY